MQGKVYMNSDSKTLGNNFAVENTEAQRRWGLRKVTHQAAAAEIMGMLPQEALTMAVDPSPCPAHPPHDHEAAENSQDTQTPTCNSREWVWPGRHRLALHSSPAAAVAACVPHPSRIPGHSIGHAHLQSNGGQF